MSSDRTFVNGEFYHIYNRGVAKQTIFHDDSYYRQFFLTLNYYLEQTPVDSLSTKKKQADQLKLKLDTAPANPLVRVHAYCFMPNHFHLLLEQIRDGGISIYLRRSQLSYTRFYNTRRDRVGPIFQGSFQTVRINNDSQLLHVSRYIHLNPFVAKLTDQPVTYLWSSLVTYYQGRISRFCNPNFILNMAGSTKIYQQFVEDYASYAQDLHAFKKILIDD